MDEALRSLSDYGVTGALLVIALIALGYVVREDRHESRRQRDEAIAGWKAQTAATDKLADRVAALEQRLIDELTRERRQ